MRPTAIGRWLKDNEGLGWAGVVIGSLGLLASPIFGWATPVGIAVLVAGGVLLGVLLWAYVTRPTKYNLVCLKCETTYLVSGVRGASTSRRENCLFQANASMDTFVYAMKRRSGNTLTQTIKYRNLREGKGWYILPKERIFPVSAPGGYTSYTIQPPAPIKKGDKIEICDEITIDKTFEADHESVAKTLLYPTKSLQIRLEFENCSVGNCMGTRFVVTPFDGEKLELVSEGNKSVLSWNKDNCESQETYRVSWTWM